MAKGISYVPNRGAVRRLLSDAVVSELTEGYAEKCASVANGMLSKDDGYACEGFEVAPMDMSGFVVRTKTDHARYSQAKSRTLTKAFKSIG